MVDVKIVVFVALAVCVFVLCVGCVGDGSFLEHETKIKIIKTTKKLTICLIFIST